MSRLKGAINEWAGSDRPSVPSISEVRTSGQVITAEARKAAEFAKETVSKAANLALAVGVGTAYWLVDDRLDGTPSPMNRAEALAESSAARLKAFGGAVMDRISGSLEGVAEVFDPTVGHQQLAQQAERQTNEQFDRSLGE